MKITFIKHQADGRRTILAAMAVAIVAWHSAATAPHVTPIGVVAITSRPKSQKWKANKMARDRIRLR
jgi:hypothetical protein